MKKDSQIDLWAKVKAKRYPRKDLKKVSKKARMPLETSIQSTVFDWARGYGAKLDGIDMLFSIPNGAVLGNPNYNRFALIGKLKREGLTPGVLDSLLAVARGGYHGLFLECKVPGRPLSDEQISFKIRAEEEGYKVIVYDQALDAIAAIIAYLKYDE